MSELPFSNDPSTVIDTQLEVEGEKRRKIAEIITADQSAFEEWIKDKDHARRLDMPKAVLRYLLIPPRILELADDPAAIDLLIVDQNSQQVKSFVIEHKTQPITNYDSLVTYWDTEEWLKQEEQARSEATGGLFIFASPKVPSEVDQYHAKNRALIENGRLGLNDYVANDISLEISSGDQIYVGNYQDREIFRGKGVATSFYSRLHEAAGEIGIRFIKGSNNRRNISYFTDKLGRSTLAEIKPELRTVFHSDPKGINMDNVTIDFIKPEDKAVFVSSEK